MRRLLVLLSILLGLGACNRPAPAPRTAEELRAAIAGYTDGKADVTEQQIDALFARLDAEIATQRADAMTRTADARDAAEREIDARQRERRDLGQEYLKAKFTRFGAAAGDTFKQMGDSIGKGLEDAGRKLRESMQGQVDRGD